MRNPGKNGVHCTGVYIRWLPAQTWNVRAEIHGMLPGSTAYLEYLGSVGEQTPQDRENVRSIALGGGREKTSVFEHGGEAERRRRSPK